MPAGSGVSVDFRRVRVADYVVLGGTLLYLVVALLPWRDYGDEFFGLYTLSGFQSSGAVSSAFVLFLLAGAWVLVPAFYELELGFPRALVTVGLAALGFLLTVVAWIGSFDAGFSPWALLGLVVAGVILLAAARTVPAQLRGRPGLQPPAGHAGTPADRPPAP